MSDFKSARRLDELGRVVIPKEIRRACRIRGGDLLQISIIEEKVCLEKYSPIKDLGTFAKDFVDALSKATSKHVLITDTKEVIAVNKLKKEYLNKSITDEFTNVIENGKSLLLNKADGGDTVKVFDGSPETFAELIVPVTTDGAVIGGVVVFSEDKGEKIERPDIVATTFGARFLEKQFDVKND